MTFQIGPHRFKNKWILAPMAGVSEMPYRVIALEMGAALAPTELISAKGLNYSNERTKSYLTHSDKEQPFSVQLFGGEPDVMARAAEMAVAIGADIIDINMGCPVKKVTKTGSGSALLCDTTRAAAVVTAIKAATGKPVTCKIRAGWDEKSINCVDVAKALQDAGAAAIALHPRTRAQGYTGKANWRYIRDLRAVLNSAVLIGNGDVTCRADALRMIAETGCDAVMIGRAALGNPWIFRELASEGEVVGASPEERLALVVRHLREQVEFVEDEKRAIRQMRQHLLWYSRGIRGAKLFRERALKTETLAEASAVVEEFFVGAQKDARDMLDDGDVDYQTAFG